MIISNNENEQIITFEELEKYNFQRWVEINSYSITVCGSYYQHRYKPQYEHKLKFVDNRYRIYINGEEEHCGLIKEYSEDILYKLQEWFSPNRDFRQRPPIILLPHKLDDIFINKKDIESINHLIPYCCNYYNYHLQQSY